MIDQAIAHYHRLLTDDPALVQASQAALEAGMQRDGLFFGDRPLCAVLRPHLVTPQTYVLMQEATRLVCGALRTLGADLLRDEHLREPLRLSAAEQRLVAVDPGYDAISAVSRLDAFLTDDGLSFIEYNAETPAGGAYSEALAALFRELPVVRRFLEETGYTLHAFAARANLTALLLDCYRAWGGRDRPQIAIVDWEGVPTTSEFTLYKRYFEEQGLPTSIVDPRALEYHNGHLYHDSTAITLVYKRVLVHELLQRADEVRPLLRAYEEGAVCMVNAPRAKLLHKKAIFALLTDERYQGGLTAPQRAAVARHVPWTRRVEEGYTTYNGTQVDLLELLQRQRERFVLKPNDEYGGTGIVIGWECDATTWEDALTVALDGDYVVQERVNVARAPFPAVVDGALQFREMAIDLDPFIIGGEADGFLTRISGATLLNVTAGTGSTVPTFVLHV